MHPKYAKRTIMGAGYNDAHAASYTMVFKQRRSREPGFCLQVLHNDRIGGEQCIACLRIVVGADVRDAYKSGFPTHAGDQFQLIRAVDELQHLGKRSIENARSDLYCTIEYVS